MAQLVLFRREMARILTCLLLAACAVAPDALTGEGEGDQADDSFLAGEKSDSLLSDAEALGVLTLVNEADLETLDVDVGLDRRAAEHLARHRAGLDEVLGTSDDDPFDSLAELDGVKWVGPRAFGKLLAYALANGYVDSTDESCLVISEYIEGGGQYNKAIELFNCGSAPLALDDFSVCLVRNGDSDCTVTGDLGSATLAAGAVTTMCRRKAFHPASLDPIPSSAQACELERPGLMTFSGDDRLLVLRGDGSVADSLGRVGFRPAPDTWANVVLDRCNLTPADGLSFYDHLDYFEVRAGITVLDYGLPPTPGCP